MSILFYSFLPRILLYIFYEHRFNRKLTYAIKDSDQGHYILRLAEETLIVESPDKNNSVLYDESEERNEPDRKTKSASLLLWHLPEVNHGHLKKILNREILSVNKINGITPTKNDKIIAQKVGNESIRSNNADVLVFVKFWESPNIRFEKVLKEILTYSSNSIIKIIPLYEDKKQVNMVNKLNWKNRIQSLNQKIGSKKIVLQDSASLSINSIL